MLKKLEISALRGATKPLELSFEKNKHITIIYGDNASGKSTICDAFEFLGAGTLGSLDSKGLGRTERYWHSTGLSPANVRVAVTTTDGTWTAKFVQSKVVVTPASARPPIRVLRRETLQQLIAQAPASRFDVVRPFLDIGAIETCEDSLKRLLADVNTGLAEAAARIAENRSLVEQYWVQADRPGTDSLSWARSETAKDTKQLDGEIAGLENVVVAIDGATSQAARLRAAEDARRAAEAEANERHELLTVEQQKAGGTPSAVVTVLQAAHDYFHSHADPDECPLCSSRERVQGIAERVDAQLTQLKALSDAMAAEENARRRFEATRDSNAQELTALREAWTRLETAAVGAVVPATIDLRETLANLRRGVTDNAGDAVIEETVLILSQALPAVREAVASEVARRREQKGFVQALATAISAHDQNYTERIDLDALLPVVKEAYDELQDERHRFVNDILNKIASRVADLYERIHPGEGLSKIKLLLVPGKKGSLDIQAEFPGTTDAPPGAYFSTSHLDSLGLCIFIALAELEDTSRTILVLDDIVASFDEPHVDRLIEVLYDVAAKFEHCICATHYKPWREKYRWGLLRKGECQFVELLPWEHAVGITLGKLVPPVEGLRELLAATSPSAQQAAASAGVVLEAILDFLTLQYECSVPRRKSRLTLGDLLPGVGKKLRAALKVQQASTGNNGEASFKEQALGPLLDKVEKFAQARNVFGCHFNDLAGHLPDKDALQFARLVLEIAELLIDPEHGWPKSDRSGSHWANSGDTRRLHPLKTPS